MVGAAVLFVLLILVYILISDIITILFRLTGLTEERARFQVISLLTNSGFTTDESEIIVQNKARRRLAQYTMLFGYKDGSDAKERRTAGDRRSPVQRQSESDSDALEPRTENDWRPKVAPTTPQSLRDSSPDKGSQERWAQRSPPFGRTVSFAQPITLLRCEASHPAPARRAVLARKSGRGRSMG